MMLHDCQSRVSYVRYKLGTFHSPSSAPALSQSVSNNLILTGMYTLFCTLDMLMFPLLKFSSWSFALFADIRLVFAAMTI